MFWAAHQQGGGSVLTLLLHILLTGALLAATGGGIYLYLKWKTRQNFGRLAAAAGEGVGTESQDSQFWQTAKNRQTQRRSQIEKKALAANVSSDDQALGVVATEARRTYPPSPGSDKMVLPVPSG